MARTVRLPTADERITIRIADERWYSAEQIYLSPGDQGFESAAPPFLRFGSKQLSVQILAPLSEANRLYGEGLKVHDPLIMDGDVLSDEEDPRVRELREAFLRFGQRLDDSFDQTITDFVEDPQFFNFQNFIAKNAFALNLTNKLLDMRNSVVYRADKISQRANQLLLSLTLFGSTPSNINEVRSTWENILFFPQKVNMTPSEGYELLSNFFDGRRAEEGVHVIVTKKVANQNYNKRKPVLSVRRHVRLPANTSYGAPTAGRNGFALVLMDEDSPIDQSPFRSLTSTPITTERFTYPAFSPLKYKRKNVSHATILSRNRINRSPSTGYNPGGSVALQARTPIFNKINKRNIYKIPMPSRRPPVKSMDKQIFGMTAGHTRVRLSR